MFRETITSGLGYCCTWYFFQLFRDNEVIADRLGFAADTVRKRRKAAKACGGCSGCRLATLADAQAKLKELR